VRKRLRALGREALERRSVAIVFLVLGRFSMHSLLRVLMLLLLVFSPCAIGCSSQVSEEEAERIEAQEEGADPGEFEDVEEEEDE